jgi:hypothetical protein
LDNNLTSVRGTTGLDSFRKLRGFNGLDFKDLTTVAAWSNTDFK